MLEGLNFATDKDPRQPFDRGAIAIETKSAAFYNLLKEYRSHEVTLACSDWNPTYLFLSGASIA
jgi:hypothetical protein